MLNHSLSRRSRAALTATLAAIAIAATPALAHADPPFIPTTQPDSEPLETELLHACPVDGSSTFEDSWGWARSGGRRHKGVDIIADRGTPIVAVRAGSAQFKTSGLGGRSIWLTTDDGDKFFYAHLDSWEGEGRDVQAGDVIGYVGSSGNAHGTHLHFETWPDDRAENPFPHTLGACVPTPSELADARDRLIDAGSSTPFTSRG